MLLLLDVVHAACLKCDANANICCNIFWEFHSFDNCLKFWTAPLYQTALLYQVAPLYQAGASNTTSSARFLSLKTNHKYITHVVKKACGYFIQKKLYNVYFI